jgi:uncharacterized protein YbcV (DUF1398 family)
MFTFDQINDVHDQFGKANTLFQYAQALNALGVIYVNSYVTDGRSEYFGKDGYVVKSPTHHKTFTVAEKSSEETFHKYMQLAKEGQLGYVKMSKGFAESGVEMWRIDTEKATLTYYDKSGKQLLVEELS